MESDKLYEYYPSFFENPEDYFERVFEEVEDKLAQHTIRVYNRECKEPRLGVWFSDNGGSYKYSKAIRQTHSFNEAPLLSQMRDKICEFLGIELNSCLVNYYRNGSDNIGKHSDDESGLVSRKSEFGNGPDIVSVSLGQPRKFRLQRKGVTKGWEKEFKLGDGDMLWMRGDCQKQYVHWIPQEKRITNSRMNLTFRMVKAPKS